MFTSIGDVAIKLLSIVLRLIVLDVASINGRAAPDFESVSTYLVISKQLKGS